MNDDALSPNEAAEYIKRKPDTMAVWRCHGIGPAYYKKSAARNAKVFYLKSDLDDWLRAREEAATSFDPAKALRFEPAQKVGAGR